jgi:hypothetical protein
MFFAAADLRFFSIGPAIDPQTGSIEYLAVDLLRPMAARRRPIDAAHFVPLEMRPSLIATVHAD